MKDQNRTKKQLTDELLKLRHKIGELQVKVKQHECTERTLEEYQTVIENSRDMIAVVNQHYRYVLANAGFIEYRGLDREHVIGRSVLDVLGKDVFEEVVKKNLDNCFQGKIVQYQMRYAYPKLGERDLLVQYFPIETPGGINRVVSVIQDITERKQMEEALRESEQRYRSLVESTSDWVWEVDKNGFYTYASPKVKDLLGYGPEEIIGKKPFDLMPLYEAGRIGKLFGDILESRTPFEALENTNLHKDGRLVVLETSGVPIFDKEGNLTGYRGIDRNITERKRTEQALSESENTHRIVADFTYDWECWRGPDDRFLYISPSCERITGYTREEFIQDHELYSRILHPDDRGHVMSHLREAQFCPEPCELEFRIVRRDGQERWIGHVCNLVLDANGQSLGRRASNRDITKRKHAEQALQDRTFELQQLTDKLEQRVQERTAQMEKANEELRHLSSKLLSAQEEERKRVAGEIHDTIGACLSAVMFKVQDVLRQTEQGIHAVTEPLRTIIPVVQESMDECRRIQMDLRPSMLDDIGIIATLSWFCRRYQTIYPGIRIEQEMDIQEGEMPKSLKIVIYRVIQEAMNNIAKHGKADFVCLSLRKRDDKLELVLQDNGRGFDQEKAHSQESTKRGLGLSSMRERVELSRGSFVIESTEGKGTTIRASWPLSGNK